MAFIRGLCNEMRDRLVQARRHPHLLYATLDSFTLMLLVLWYFRDPYQFWSEPVLTFVVAAMFVILNQVLIISALRKTGIQFDLEWVLLYILLRAILLHERVRYFFLSKEDRTAEESRRSA